MVGSKEILAPKKQRAAEENNTRRTRGRSETSTSTSDVQSIASTQASMVTRSTTEAEESMGDAMKNTRFTDKNLDPNTGILRCRLTREEFHSPNKCKKKYSVCQLHKWGTKGRFI